jgi:predicted dehydrogenase/threonine dehydrogenase-like Zn-dependent dehydrogenase
MKQLLQDMRHGKTTLVEAPAPHAGAGELVICSSVSLISSGTERMLVGFGRASYLEKARQQPEKVRMVLEKIRSEGLLSTIEAVQSKLSQPVPLGYCNVGIVMEAGSGISDLKAGDRVVSNGPHADVVRVPRNLCARIPEAVSDDEAAFAVVASIGLQGVRLALPTLGEAFVVTGAGLIGLLTIQLLRAHGCRVLAIDFDASKLALAKSFGAETCNPGAGEDPVSAGLAFSRGRGVDGVIIAASTESAEPVTQAARMCRKRGRIILVGVAALELNRADFYEKELTFQVSCSYGPGRYDPEYEVKGHDYPLGFVRWTEQRNFEAVLDMLASRQLDVKPMISHRFDFENAPQAYESLMNDKTGLGTLLVYSTPAPDRMSRTATLNPERVIRYAKGKPVVGFIGAGNYASRVLIPAFRHAGAQLHRIVTAGGINGVIHGTAGGFAEASTDLDTMFPDQSIDAVVIVTRHDSHAALVCRALDAHKHVFVEKPLAIDVGGLEEIKRRFKAAHDPGDAGGPQLMVGFNRRFSPQIMKMKELLITLNAPKSFVFTINAGEIPAAHWTQDRKIGGGRIIGEACHFIDLMRFLAGNSISSVQARCLGGDGGLVGGEDKAVITLGFVDGSFGTIHYLANGAPGFPKERIEVFAEGRVLQLDNFRKLSGFGWSGFSRMNLWRQDKGQKNCAAAFLKSLESGVPAIPVEEIFEVSEVTLRAAEILRSQDPA